MSAGLCWLVAGVLLAADVSRGGFVERCPEGLRLRLPCGLACGVRRSPSSHVSFLALPYARQPLGNLRFQELEPEERWSGYLDASRPGPVCPQTDPLYLDLMRPAVQSEACIHVNVHVPAHALPRVSERGEPRTPRHLLPTPTTPVSRAPTGLPIVVFVHGGGFAFGSGDPDVYGPEYLVSQGVIVVTFNYRLNVFGFLSLGSAEVPGNAGLRDVVTLLRWVQRAAHSFGGDPADVTLAGQSAGAAAAHLMTLSPAAAGLFHRVILMSGVSTRSFFSPSPLYAGVMAKKLVDMLGINSTDPYLIHQELITTPLDKLMAANRKIQRTVGLGAFYPVIEGRYPGVTRVVEAEPDELMASGRGADIPMLIGFTEAECETFFNVFTDIDIVKMIKNTPQLIVPPNLLLRTPPTQKLLKEIEVMKQRYFNETTVESFTKYCSDAMFIYPAMWVARRRAERGAASTFLYQFSYEGQQRPLERGRRFTGAAHIEDMTYVFQLDGSTPQPRSPDASMHQWMITLFTNFMRCSYPAGSNCSSSAWPPTSIHSLQYQDIRKPLEFHMRNYTDQQQDMVQFFDELYMDL